MTTLPLSYPTICKEMQSAAQGKNQKCGNINFLYSLHYRLQYKQLRLWGLKCCKPLFVELFLLNDCGQGQTSGQLFHVYRLDCSCYDGMSSWHDGWLAMTWWDVNHHEWVNSSSTPTDTWHACIYSLSNMIISHKFCLQKKCLITQVGIIRPIWSHSIPTEVNILHPSF